MSIKKSIKLDFVEITNKIKLLKRFSSDRDIADWLGFTPQAFNARKKRNQFPIKELKLKCATESINIDSVVTGEGEMFREAKDGLETPDKLEFKNLSGEEMRRYYEKQINNLEKIVALQDQRIATLEAELSSYKLKKNIAG